MKVNINSLLTIKSYADKFNVTASYIYKLIKEKKLEVVKIDNVQFIDASVYPEIPRK